MDRKFERNRLVVRAPPDRVRPALLAVLAEHGWVTGEPDPHARVVRPMIGGVGNCTVAEWGEGEGWSLRFPMHRAATGLARQLDTRTALLVSHRYGESYEEWEADGRTLVSDDGLEAAIRAGLLPRPRDQDRARRGTGDPMVDRLGLPPDPPDPMDERAVGEPLLLWHRVVDPCADRPDVAAQFDALAARARASGKAIVPGVGTWFVQNGQLWFKPALPFRQAVGDGGVHATARSPWGQALTSLSLAHDVVLGRELWVGLNWKPASFATNPATSELIGTSDATWPIGWGADTVW